MLLSIVSGTYNRMLDLEEMVASARKSINGLFEYEFVIVDGGSQDGTVEWCTAQRDVRFIQQGKLLGAVKAFNEGCENAQGDYVILANDDITFLGSSVQRSVLYMLGHPECGIGCFYQDRYDRPFHIGQVSAVIDGKQRHTNMGQVCIVPRWLGDCVGWWGNYLYTYAGDAELTCNILQAGFKVNGIPDCSMHDKVVKDGLRLINNPNPEHNEDNHKWSDRWTRNGLRGPIVRSPNFSLIKLNTHDPIPRILYSPLYEKGFKIQHDTKTGLINALRHHGLALEVEFVGNKPGLFEAASYLKPDIVLMQIQDTKSFTLSDLAVLRKTCTGAKLINWNGDLRDSLLFSNEYIKLMKKFDLALTVTAHVEEKWKEAGINWDYWQIGYEDYTDPIGFNEQDIDVIFLGNCYSKKREELSQVMMKSGKKVSIYGMGYPPGVSSGKCQYDFVTGHTLYRRSKISIGDMQFPNSLGYVSNRFFQQLRAGAFILQQEVPGMEKYIGAVDGVHYVSWDSFEDLAEKIKIWSSDDEEVKIRRDEIAMNGRLFVESNYSFDHLVRRLFRKHNLTKQP